jgi:signal peptidase II
MKKSLLPFFSIAIFIFVLDQATKYYIKAHLGHYDAISVLPFFNIVYAENTGSAFGMFKSLGMWFFIGVSAAAVVFISILIIRDRVHALAYAFLLGGAAGNLFDRAFYGFVVDFLDFYIGAYHWPAFNVADSALTFGIGLLFFKILIAGKKN